VPEPAPNPDADGLVGQILMYGGETLPSPKYRWCHGVQTLSRTEFSLLFSRYGESWGTGDGSTTFNLPDFDKRFPVGVDSTGADAAYDKVGDTGGSESGSVSGTTGAGSSHVHGPGSYSVSATSVATGGAAVAGFPTSGTQAVSGTSGAENSHTHPFSGTAATVPPYKAVRFIVKVS
jgi:microcystin-dependent protein